MRTTTLAKKQEPTQEKWIECPHCFGFGHVLTKKGEIILCPTCAGAKRIRNR